MHPRPQRLLPLLQLHCAPVPFRVPPDASNPCGGGAGNPVPNQKPKNPKKLGEPGDGTNLERSFYGYELVSSKGGTYAQEL